MAQLSAQASAAVEVLAQLSAQAWTEVEVLAQLSAQASAVVEVLAQLLVQASAETLIRFFYQYLIYFENYYHCFAFLVH